MTEMKRAYFQNRKRGAKRWVDDFYRQNPARGYVDKTLAWMANSPGSHKYEFRAVIVDLQKATIEVVNGTDGWTVFT